MTNQKLIEYVRAQLKEVEAELNRPHERTDGAYLSGKQVVLIDILQKLEEMTRNPDFQEENEYTKKFDEMLKEYHEGKELLDRIGG